MTAMRHTESDIQKCCVAWFRAQYPKLALNLIAIPNGGARSRVEAAIMKGEGVTAGAADLGLFVPCKGYHGLFIEMKTPKGRQQPSQKAWQAAVEAQGYKYVVCHGYREFVDEVNGYLR